MKIILIYSLMYFILIGGVVLVGFFLHLKKSKIIKGEGYISKDEITVLIPFRNEEKRLQTILNSFIKANSLPKQIIFIDDHSDDHSVKLIRDQLGNRSYEILSMPDDVIGKKRALREGIKMSQTKYILTFDADISFQSNYFDSLETLEEADMYVLPVILIGNNFSEWCYELDVALANALNTGLSGWLRPIFSSGANFLFSREVFNNVDDLNSHIHMSSGDDVYLLRDFRRAKKDIRLVSDLNVAVSTETPHSFKEFIDQRLRWIGKTTNINDSFATLTAIGQFLFTIAFFVLLINAVVGKYWDQFAVLFAVKIGLDLLFFFPYFNRIRRIKSWWLISIYELFFPFYSLLLGVLMLSYRPKWKGRAIESNSG